MRLIDKVKQNVNMRWIILSPSSLDLNISKNGWHLLNRVLPSLTGLNKYEKYWIVQ